MEKQSSSNKSIINHSFSPIERPVNFTRILFNKPEKNIFTKLFKPSKAKTIHIKKKKEMSENKKVIPKKKNLIKFVPSKLSFIQSRNTIPPIKISETSKKRKDNNIQQLLKNNSTSLHFTRLKTNKLNLNKLGQYQNDSKIIRRVTVNNRNIHLFSSKNNRKEIEKQNSTFMKEDKKQFSFHELNTSTKLPFSKISLKQINDYQYSFPHIKDLSKFFHNETLKMAMKNPIKMIIDE